MERRTFMVLVSGSLLAAPLAVAARPAGKIARIGILTPTAAPNAHVDAFEHSLQGVGLVKGQNLRIEIRTAASREAAVVPIVAELASLSPDVLVTRPVLDPRCRDLVTSTSDTTLDAGPCCVS